MWEAIYNAYYTAVVKQDSQHAAEHCRDRGAKEQLQRSTRSASWQDTSYENINYREEEEEEDEEKERGGRSRRRRRMRKEEEERRRREEDDGGGRRRDEEEGREGLGG